MNPFQIALGDPEFPDILKQISQPPKRLWGCGEARFLSEGVLVAVVGSRKCSRYGEETAFSLARDLARAGVTVVSGLAYGIDASAHRGALEGGGATVAVLGCGIDVPYPADNQELKKRIAGHGAVITELPPGTEASRWTFPQRNRIISGLSRGVVVVEAGLKSGSLITVDFALEQGREVFAVPGNVTSATSEGTNRLIRNGAKLVSGVRDILEELGPIVGGLSAPATKENSPVGVVEKRILDILENGPKHMDDLVETVSLPVEKISPLLMQLEIGGTIVSLPGGRFARKE